jgi:hypothetical protein
MPHNSGPSRPKRPHEPGNPPPFHSVRATGAIVDALILPDHIAQWWTKEAKIRDGKLIVGWSGFGWKVVLDVAHEMSSRIVSWRCLQANMQNTNAWEGTTMTFSLSPEADDTHLKFRQNGYRDSPCYGVCSQGSAFFVGSNLKQYVETGPGIPYPTWKMPADWSCQVADAAPAHC